MESLQIIINRMVSKKIKDAKRVILDIDDYRKRRSDSMVQMARRIIHLILKEDPSLKTESIGDGEFKKVKIIPIK